MPNQRKLLFSVFAEGCLAAIVISVALASANTGGSTKQAVLQRIAARQTAAAQVTPPPKVHAAPPQTSCPQTITPGIFPVHEETGIIMHTYTLENAADVISSSGIAYTLLAGALQSNPQQGVILVQRVRIDPCASTSEYPQTVYSMPTQAGAITLTSITTNAIAFKKATGATGTFAYVSGQFGR